MAGIDTLALYTIGNKPLCFSSVKSFTGIRIDVRGAIESDSIMDININSVEPASLNIKTFSYATPDIGKYTMVTWDAFLEDVFPSEKGIIYMRRTTTQLDSVLVDKKNPWIDINRDMGRNIFFKIS